MKQIYLILWVFLVGCSSEIEPMYKSSTPIDFGVNFDMTKANLSTNKGDVLSMGLFSLYTQKEFSAPFYEQMNNMRVHRPNKDKPFTYSPVSYWPESGYLSFFAYSPFIITPSEVLQTQITADGYPKLIFENPTKLGDQIDLMVSTQLNKQPPANASEAQVDLNFSHLLSAITFKAKTVLSADDRLVSVESVSLSGLNGKGTYTFANPTIQFLDLTAPVDYLISSADGLLSFNLTSEAKLLLSAENYLLVLPQNIPQEGVNLITKLQIKDMQLPDEESDTKEIVLNIHALINSFQAGKKYVFTISYESEATILLNYEVLDWDKKEVDIPEFN